TVLADAAHNPHGARALAAALLGEFRFTRLVGVLGVMRDKDARGILAELEPVLAEVVITANSSPRAMDPDELGALATEIFGAERVSVEPVLRVAVEQAGELAEEGGESGVGVVVTGSVVTVGETRTLFGKEPS
ncbi:MAG: dihydrofolate synthase, partial [Pseudonocardia sp.]|nr:dihydrofolate synthase [Pseudonocardia sp.]